MIHDLSIDGIFRQNSNGFIQIPTPASSFESSSFSKYEALLTGDAYDRKHKRFMIDYYTEQCMCDRCGRTILRKPWSFEVSKLCKKCDEELEAEYGNRNIVEETLNSLTDMQELVSISPRVTYSEPSPKAWDMEPDVDSSKPTDNIFLWD